MRESRRRYRRGRLHALERTTSRDESAQKSPDELLLVGASL